jgi:release factor glutamine methyltransferase
MLVDVLRRERPPAGGRALDLCTGSGVIAIAAAQAGWTVSAVDISRRAVVAARAGGALNGVRIDARRGSLFGPVAGERFDLITSNPPYVPSPDGQIPTRGAARAWEGGSDGRTLLDQICAGASAHLNPGGVILLVHSAVCGEVSTVRALEAEGLAVDVALRHRGPLGPLLRSRAGWLRERGLLGDGDEEEMIVIRGRRPLVTHSLSQSAEPAGVAR